MENLIIKRKEFEILEIITSITFKCNYKKHLFFVKKYEPDSIKLDMLKKIHKSSVTLPKTKYIDKKTGYVAREFLDGVLMSDYILDHDFDENIYKEIFRNNYMARVVGLNLDYSLDKWMLVSGKLFYVGDYCEKYDPKNDFSKTKIREWFLTRELAQYYKNNGILFDKKRIKEEHAVNKEMVLTICKYYL